MEFNHRTTVNDRDFDQIFAEVTDHGEKLDVCANSELRLFYLRGITDYHFPIENLRKFLSKNIGAYVFSRSRIHQFELDGDAYSVGIEAMDIMRKNGDADQRGTGNELGEIMVFTFLESVLKAPKIYSKVELSKVGGGGSASDSIHVKLLGIGESSVNYEMVFAASGIIGTFTEAVDAVFSHIAEVKERSTDEISLVDESIFNFPNDDPVVKEMRPLIKPEPGKTINRDSAYGIFLGYTLGLRKDNRSSDEYRNLVEPKMAADLKQYAPYIRQKIIDLGLSRRSFYIYVFPLDDSAADKQAIMKKVLREE